MGGGVCVCTCYKSCQIFILFLIQLLFASMLYMIITNNNNNTIFIEQANLVPRGRDPFGQR